eukprot:356121-Chlamydomonas_euryale.AAC.2
MWSAYGDCALSREDGLASRPSGLWTARALLAVHVTVHVRHGRVLWIGTKGPPPSFCFGAHSCTRLYVGPARMRARAFPRLSRTTEDVKGHTAEPAAHISLAQR